MSEDSSSEGSDEEVKNNEKKSQDDESSSDSDKKRKKRERKKREVLQPHSFITTEDTKYKILNLIGSGGFGDVYRVRRMKKVPGEHSKFAMKTELADIDKNLSRLKIEMAVLQECKKLPEHRRVHFVRLIDKGRTKQFKFIIMELVGSSIDVIQREMPHRTFSFATSTRLGLVTVDAIADVHSLGYIHRDIKPQNFSVGTEDKATNIYILDFGIARKFTAKDSNAVRQPREMVRFMGTVRYASRNCHQEREQCRRDDLESWLYMLLEFYEYKSLPWVKVIAKDAVLKKKEELFAGNYEKSVAALPEQIHEVVQYINKLEYTNEPDYDFIKKLLRTAADKKNACLEAKYDWQPDSPPVEPGKSPKGKSPKGKSPKGKSPKKGKSKDKKSKHKKDKKK